MKKATEKFIEQVEAFEADVMVKVREMATEADIGLMENPWFGFHYKAPPELEEAGITKAELKGTKPHTTIKIGRI